MTRHAPLALFAAIVLFVASEFFLAWPSLPEVVATHFNAAGDPNGWSTRGELFLKVTAMLGIFALLFAAAAWLERLPDQWINLPNKEYWLDAQRRTSTFATMRDFLRYLLLAPMAFLNFVITAGLNANLAAKPHFDANLQWPVVMLLALMAAMIAWPYWRFRRPKP